MKHLVIKVIFNNIGTVIDKKNLISSHILCSVINGHKTKYILNCILSLSIELIIVKCYFLGPQQKK